MIRIMILTLIAIILPLLLTAEAVTEFAEFEVFGSCGMCKSRIEKAALIEGVNSAEWNKESQMLEVQFIPAVTTKEDIHKSIAAIGHDTEMYQADNDVYDNLPACCQYERFEKSEKPEETGPSCH